MNDFKYAFRMLRKSPGFSAVVVLTLALGIGMNTAIFSVLDTVLLRVLPYRAANRLVWIYQNKPQREWLQWPMGLDTLQFYQEQSSSFEYMALAGPTDFYLAGEGRATELLHGLKVTANLCDFLGAQPLLGRSFRPEECLTNAPKVAMLSYRLWQRRFGGNPDIVGKVIHSPEKSYTVVGVLPPNPKFPIGPMPSWRVLSSGDPEIWLPMAPDSAGALGFAIGRLKPETNLKQAQTEMDSIARRRGDLFKIEGWSIELVPLRDQVAGQIRPALLLVQAAVGIVLLVACVNVANLLLARALNRQKEFGIRAAMGASRLQLVRQLAVEGLLLSVLGGFSGLLLAHWGLKVFAGLGSVYLPRWEEIRLDGRVLGFTLGLSCLSALLFSMAPAWQVCRQGMKTAIEGLERGSTATPARKALLRWLVTAEVALSLVLLVAAGLLLRSFSQVLNVQLGYRPEHLLVMNRPLPSLKYSTDEAKENAAKEMLDYVQSLPGVAAAGFSFGLPLAKGVPIGKVFRVEGRSMASEDPYRKIRLRVVSPGYFSAMGISLIKGQGFSRNADLQSERREVLLNQSAARVAFPGEDPIGKECNFGPIIGVVADTLDVGLDRAPEPQFYIEGYATVEPFLVIRTFAEPEMFKTTILKAIAERFKDAPVYNLKTMDQTISDSVAPRRFQAILIGAFGFCALFLTALGVYAVIAYLASQRRLEIGIRLALGAQTGEILRLILAQGMKPVLLGMALGCVATLGVTPILAHQLFGVGSMDWVTYLSVILVLGTVSLLACYWPAMRAAKVPPMDTLKGS